MDRKEKILYSIISSYIKDGKAVGSRTLSKSMGLDVSPATIRNDMSDLEDMGLLEKTHVSSGRIPSDKAYRQYVDTIIELGVERFEIPQLAHRSIDETSNAIDSLIDNATEILSLTTNYAAMSLMPNMGEIRLKHFKIFPMSTHEIVIIYVYDNRAVKSNAVKLNKPFNESQLDVVERILRSKIEGEKLCDIENILINIDHDIGNSQYLIDEITSFILKDIKKDTKVKFSIQGLENLLYFNEFSKVEETKPLLDKIEKDKILVKLMIKELDEDIEVYVGKETGFKELENFSVVLGKFGKGNMIGKIGVLGPKRMEYSKVIRDIDLMRQYINSMASLGGIYG